MDDWNELNFEANANLSCLELSEFYRYKAELKKDGHKWANDAEDILRGFIWECLEEENEEI